MTRTKRPRAAAMSPGEMVDLIARSGLNRAEFAERLGVTRQTVWMWTTGKTPISRSVVALIRSVIKTVK